MNTTSNASSISRLLSYLVGVVTVMQTAITAIPIEDKTVVSAVFLFLAIALTAAKQSVSVEVNWRKSKWPTIILLVIAILGAVNEAGLIDIANFSAATSQWIRVGLTFIVLSLDEAVKTFFPTYEAKRIETVKSKLASEE